MSVGISHLLLQLPLPLLSATTMLTTAKPVATAAKAAFPNSFFMIYLFLQTIIRYSPLTHRRTPDRLGNFPAVNAR
ncbi:MAG: hypothetical protein M2R45_00871 [Verrucomicrobia subdivision 3 bacterium]|nr:hypothetical protein [Limisphaerales bacterium]MCS1414539.1 hypothetical protein [Limisphaerales bacterium]